MFNSFGVRFLIVNMLVVAVISIGLLSFYNHVAHGQSTMIEALSPSE